MVNLEAKTIDSKSVLVTEHNVSKDYKKFPELYANTPQRVREAIESGRTEQISPIVVLQNPFDSIERTSEAYQKYTQSVPRQGGRHFENEDQVLKDVLEQNHLLCYNGNRRLEQFQRARFPIRAFVITSQEDYEQMPQEERRIPEELKDKRPTQYQINQNYILSYLGLLDDVVYIQAEERHWQSFDGAKSLAEMRERRKNKSK